MTISAYLDGNLPNKILIIGDENTLENCLPHVLQSVDLFADAEIMELPSGEENKTMDICMQVYASLTEMEFGRDDLLVGLGGGVICDMIGFIAGTFKRGVRFITLPTSLLSMVDASVGGKTGIDFGVYKNQIGLFNFADLTVIDAAFLNTLPAEEVQNGLAEMIKHGVIADVTHFNVIEQRILNGETLSDEDLWKSVGIKAGIVELDPNEKGLRKTLNFGHTVGHAIESYSLETDKMAHGLAVIHGMKVEAEISEKVGHVFER